jgi:hypothetical protein
VTVAEVEVGPLLDRLPPAGEADADRLYDEIVGWVEDGGLQL